MPGPCVALHHAVFGTEICRNGGVELRVVDAELRFVLAFIARSVALGGDDRIFARHSGCKGVFFAQLHFLPFGIEHGNFRRAHKFARVLGGEQGRNGDRLADQCRGGQVGDVARRDDGADGVFDRDGLGHFLDRGVGRRQDDGVVAELVGAELPGEQLARRAVGAGELIILDGDRQIGCRPVLVDDLGARKIGFVHLAQFRVRKRKVGVDDELPARGRTGAGLFFFPRTGDEGGRARDEHQKGQHEQTEFFHFLLLV